MGGQVGESMDRSVGGRMAINQLTVMFSSAGSGASPTPVAPPPFPLPLPLLGLAAACFLPAVAFFEGGLATGFGSLGGSALASSFTL